MNYESEQSFSIFEILRYITEKGEGISRLTKVNTVGKIPQNCVITNFTNIFGFLLNFDPEIDFYLNLWTKISLQIFSFSRILFPTVQ